MSKHRALKKLRNSLPKSPGRRVSTVAAYVKSSKSPTINTLQKVKLIKTPDENVKQSLGEAILEDLKLTVSATKLKRTDNARATMNIIRSPTASVSGETVKHTRSKVSLAKTLGVPVRRISSGLSLRTNVLHTQSSSYLYTKRKVRSDALSDENRKLIHDFWSFSETSHPTGNKNDIKRVRIGPNTYSSHPVQILEKSQSEVFSDFRLKYPDIKVSQSLFERCKPYFVRQASKKDRMTCCCRYHLEMKHVFKAAMSNRKQLNKTLTQENQLTVYDTISDLCNATLCEANESGYHSKTCVDRECAECGVQLINFSDRELDTTDEANDIEWQCFEYINVKSKTGLRKKLMLVKKKTKPGLMISYFLNLLKTFPAHNLRAKWQAQQLKQLVRNLPSNDVVTIHDYSENYRCKDKTEIQSSYFQKTEISLHVTLIHRHAILEVDGVEGTSEEPQIITEQFFVISDDDKHDQYFTFQVQKFIAEYLSSISYNVETMHEFCDGCSCQYKSRHCFGNLLQSRREFGYNRIIRNFFETSHAKGPQDAAGGLIKNQTDLAVIRGNITVQNGSDLFNFANSKLKIHKSAENRKRHFRYIECINRNFPMHFRPIPGIRSIHQTIIDNNGMLARSLSCYTCTNCLSGDYSACQSVRVTGKVSNVEITPEGNRHLDDNDNNDSTDEDIPLYDMISKNAIFAVLCDDDSCDYYLLKAVTGRYELDRRETDKWGITYEIGSNVIKGNYFQQSDNPLHFRLIERKHALVPASSCLYICVDINVNRGLLILTEDVHQSILKCVEMSSYVM